MTSRETTGLLPKIGETLVEGGRSRSLGDWAALLAFGAIQWPWLLRSLDGGTKDAKKALLERLDLPEDALPHLGSWKADTGLLTWLVDHVLNAKPRTIVEFGAGASSLVLARALQKVGGGTLISFDQHVGFVDATRQWLADYGLSADLRSTKLKAVEGWPGLWYDHGPLPTAIDLMVIDGPPWTIHPLTRGGAESLFANIAPGGIVVLDDAARPGERMVARRWRKLHPEFEFTLWKGGTKGTLIGRKLG